MEGWIKWIYINLLIPLLKNDAQLKQKSDKQKKKKWSPKFIIKKIMYRKKKSRLNKKKKKKKEWDTGQKKHLTTY